MINDQKMSDSFLIKSFYNLFFQFGEWYFPYPGGMLQFHLMNDRNKEISLGQNKIRFYEFRAIV